MKLKRGNKLKFNGNNGLPEEKRKEQWLKKKLIRSLKKIMEVKQKKI